ncbi:probable RNA polymerase II nuclear localization protein SLC7A6OS [Bolinopsis microptera]|uniref:probable RNA polymerase II nuclear localization protein SLC7A6OS n=1 Tax=Bolinopsis microptera TaxID=2820187 RepID=UPI00307A0177
MSDSSQPKETTAAPPKETTAAPLSVLYVKRKRDEPSNPSLFVQFDTKRQKVFNEFKFVTSTPTEPKRLDRDELHKKYKHENTVSDIKEKCRRDQNTARKNNKYNLISSLRTDDGALFSAEVQDPNEDDIICNAEKMLSEKLSLNEAPPSFVSNGTEEWVYDVYLCENVCQGDIDAIHSEQLEELDFEPAEKQKFINEYDEDSNDENFYGNDYPDEEASSSGDSEKDSDDSERVVSKMRCSNEFFDSEYHGVNKSHYLDKYLCSDTDSD